MVTTLQRYENLVQIGTGSMGTVYRARDKVLDRDVALKMMRTGAGVDSDIRERFYREARACARLKHPNIVSVYDLGEDGDVAYIAMELLQGADLRRVFEQRRKLSLPVQLQAMIDVCEALDHAHRHGVIHRDIKPSNLMLQDDNRVKVMDFGIARLPSSRLTMAGKILGTPNYMAPEQILGKPCDGRADLFSAAIVFFELLTCQHPFQADVILKRIVEGEPDSIFDHSARVPLPMEKIISKALRKDPEQRYANATEMASDLRALLDAVRQNASPTMASMELPSDRMLPHDEPAIEHAHAQVSPAPKGEDPSEWRLSEVLRLIPAFEEAVDKGDRTAAAARLDELRAIASADRRFATPAASCEDAFQKKWPEERHRAVAAGVPGPGPVFDKGPMGIGVAVEDAPLPPVSEKVNGQTAPAEPPPAKARPAREKGTQPSWLAEAHLPGMTPSQTRLLAGTVVAVFALFLATSVIRRAFPVEVLQNAVGSATVQASPGRIRAQASGNAEVLTTLPRGAAVNLLEVPSSRSTLWLRVQYVPNAKPVKPGYMLVSDLSAWPDWKMDDPAAALRLAKLMMPAEGESDAQIREYIESARRFIGQIPGPVADEVKADIGHLESVIAGRQATPAAESVAPALTAESTPPVATQEQAEKPGEKERASAWAKRADISYRSADFAGARNAVGRALRLDPQNSEALRVLEDLKKVEDLSGRSQ